MNVKEALERASATPGVGGWFRNATAWTEVERRRATLGAGIWIAIFGVLGMFAWHNRAPTSTAPIYLGLVLIGLSVALVYHAWVTRRMAKEDEAHEAAQG